MEEREKEERLEEREKEELEEGAEVEEESGARRRDGMTGFAGGGGEGAAMERYL